jgi:hypothetical protein
MENSRDGVIVMCRAPLEARLARLNADGHIPETTAEAMAWALLCSIEAGIEGMYV